jgi:hypothetical protein
LAHHVHWPARLGSPMLISEIWYYLHLLAWFVLRRKTGTT